MRKPTPDSIALAKSMMDSETPLIEFVATLIGEVMALNYDCLAQSMEDRREEFEARGVGDLWQETQDDIDDLFRGHIGDDSEPSAAGPHSVAVAPPYSPDGRPDPWFERVVAGEGGEPVAQFRTGAMALMGESDVMLFSKEALLTRIKNLTDRGRPFDEDVRALKALAPAYGAWAKMPSDGN